MSQEKVDRYKKEKANRKKEVAKQKKNKVLAYVATVAISVAVLVLVFLSVKVLNGDISVEEPTTYSEEYLEQIRDMFKEPATTDKEEETTKAE